MFFLLVKEKLLDLGMQLDVDSIICDFELSLMIAIDTSLLCKILACPFHFKMCLQRKVDKNGFKTCYENDEHFNSYINYCSSLAHLPIQDIEDGIEFVTKKFQFHDERMNQFKDQLIQYIWDFWINDCFLPSVWSVFGRSEN